MSKIIHICDFYENVVKGKSEKYRPTTKKIFAVQFSFPDKTSFAQKEQNKLFISSFSDINESLQLLTTDVKLPNLCIDGVTDEVRVKTTEGMFKSPGSMNVMPDSDQFSLYLLDTQYPLIESFFLPWLEDVVSVNNTSGYPCVRATIHIYQFKDNPSGKNLTESDIAVEYKLYGCYPVKIDMPAYSHNSDNSISKRGVIFSLNKLEIVKVGNTNINSSIDSNKLKELSEANKQKSLTDDEKFRAFLISTLFKPQNADVIEKQSNWEIIKSQIGTITENDIKNATNKVLSEMKYYGLNVGETQRYLDLAGKVNMSSWYNSISTKISTK